MRSLTRGLLGRFRWLVCASCVVQLVVALVYWPGPVVIDEVTYHAMTRALVRGGTLSLDNGWDIFPSSELEWQHARGVGSKLVAQYPSGFPLFAAPFYALLGMRGFVVLNTLTFYGTVLLTHAIALHVFRKRALAVAAALVFLFGTYTWEYSFGVWPHAVTLFFTTAAVLLSLRSTQTGSLRRQLAAGALVGAATTMRLDAVFAMAAVLLVPVVIASKKTKSVAWSVAPLLGLLPGLALLAVTNHAKFGSWQPFSYGPWNGARSNTGLATYAPLGLVGVATLVAVHVISPRAAAIRRRHLWWLFGAMSLALVVATAMPPTRLVLKRVLNGLWMIALDLRHSDPNGIQRGLSHGPRGAFMYVGGLKKAFVQSLPWLPLALAAPWLPGLTESRRRQLVALSIPVVVNVGVFGALEWHGGLCLNLRYLLPALPFAAILVTAGAHRLVHRAPWIVRNLRELDAMLLIAIAVWLVLAVVLVYPASISVKEVFLLDAPLVVAGMLSVGLVLLALRRTGATAVLVLTMVALVWSGMTEFSYDSVTMLRARAANRRVAQVVAAHAPPGAFLFAEYPDLVSDAMERGMRIAEPARDRFAETEAIVAEVARRGIPSYAVLSEASLKRLRDASSEKLHISEPVERSHSLRRLEVVP